MNGLSGWTVVVSLLTALGARAEPKLVAVLPLHASGAMDEVDRETLDETIRSEAAAYLTPNGYTVLTGDVQLKVLRDNGLSPEAVARACESSCPLEIAQELKASLFVSGTLARGSDGRLVAFVRVYDGATGGLANTLSIEGPEFGALRKAFSMNAAPFFLKALSVLGADARGPAGVQVRVPKVRVEGAGGLSAINMEAEKLLERAQAADGDPTSDLEDRRDAWCALAALKERNAYLASADDACRQWTGYVETYRTAERAMAKDYATLGEFLTLQRKTAPEKLAIARAFLSTYSELRPQPMLTAVERATEALSTGGAVELPPAMLGPAWSRTMSGRQRTLEVWNGGEETFAIDLLTPRGVFRCTDPLKAGGSCGLSGMPSGTAQLSVPGEPSLVATLAIPAAGGSARTHVERESRLSGGWLCLGTGGLFAALNAAAAVGLWSRGDSDNAIPLTVIALAAAGITVGVGLVTAPPPPRLVVDVGP